MRVDYWQYHDGWSFPFGSEKRFEEDIVGWHCWVYGTHDERYAVIEWMKETMTGEYEAINRFNGGDPIVTVHIKEEADAMVFKLRWL
jgi:hypothetical protein